ncbi:hypothetical protein LDENG_00069730 [Lucifuga dentata]|nr:hypothetical protein LDENG_00069730 [Lucifuga dentata]
MGIKWSKGHPYNYGADCDFFNTFEFSQQWCSTFNGFFCLNLIVVKERKSWEEALEHCKENQTEFTSLIADTDVLLAQREIKEANINKRVWIGLRYLADRWLWINGDPLMHKAWKQGDQKHQCPSWSHSCGALTPEGLWESWDCQEKLSFICS